MIYVDRLYVTNCNKLLFLEENRCHTTDEKICSEREDSEKMIKAFISRRNKTEKSIKENGYLECCEARVAYWIKEPHKQYVLDGQGCLRAVEKLNEEIINDNKDKVSETELTDMLYHIPVLLYEIQTETFEEAKEEMVNSIIIMNTTPKNWTKDEQIRAIMMLENEKGEEYRQGNEVLKNVVERLHINMSTGRNICWGQGSYRKGAENSITNIWEHTNSFTVFMEQLHEKCREGGWTKKQIDFLSREKFICVIKDNFFKPSINISPSINKLFIKTALTNFPKFNDKKISRLGNGRPDLREFIKENVVNKNKKLKEAMNPSSL